MFRWGVNELDNEQLQKMTEELSLKFFHKPFRHKAIFNKRLRTIGGRYMLGNHNIEINILNIAPDGNFFLRGTGLITGSSGYPWQAFPQGK